MIEVGGVRVVVTLIEVDRNKVRLGFAAPREVRINREEVLERKEAAGEQP